MLMDRIFVSQQSGHSGQGSQAQTHGESHMLLLQSEQSDGLNRDTNGRTQPLPKAESQIFHDEQNGM